MAEHKKSKNKVCVICGTLFRSMHTYAKYCSQPCKDKARHTQEKIKKLALRKRYCKICNKEFIATNARQIYCSAECRNIHNAQNIKNWHANNQEQYQARKKAYSVKPEVRQKKRRIHKKENDASRIESISEGVYKTLYTQEEDNYILAYYKQFTKKELAQALNRTITSVQSRYKKLQKTS
ncbi:MAG: hypothetical protein LBG21_06245 [Campylobacteraceae bacterium]|jgi:hypothetical protein|nr:hypothetical protein [Campylobacteraceae bacterium]